MSEDDMTPEQWMRRPTWHGCYEDYVQHVASVRQHLANERQKRNNEEIARLVVKKLKGKK